ncbi:MAG: DMT family transporter [Acidimicrobiia bacterium]
MIASAYRSASRRSDLPILGALVAVSVWSLGPLFVRGISASTPTIVLFRLWLAVPVMVSLAYVTGGRLSWNVARVTFLPGALFAVSMVTSFGSFKLTSIANATLISALSPALILLVSGPLFAERHSARQMAGAALGIGGVAVVVLGSGATSGASFAGDALAMGNLTVWTGYLLVTKHLRGSGMHAGSFISTVFLWSAIIITPWALLSSDDLGAIGGRDWLMLAGLVFLPGLFGHGLMTWAQRHLDVTVVSLLLLANPVLSTIGAWLIYDQALRPIQLVGALILIGGLGAIVVEQRALMVVDPVTSPS